ncbi:substrate-binding domain-containing protein [Streptomyces sp. NPDC058872]|uniref:substrate-binding domain-containing protein n=1 Tax=Streptomyces sp. NPDC058872 TaxID=3346661 RepID=UPI0036B85EE9
MEQAICGLSSMATRPVLAELTEHIRNAHGISLRVDSAGGVEVARRVRQGVEADVLVLAAGVLAELAGEGHVLPDTVRPLWTSQVVAAVPEGAPMPAFASEDDLRAALLGAGTVAYSTGPSGTALVDLITRMELADALRGRLVQAPPGVPVGSLLASGSADLAFQQHSELMDVPGAVVVGPLPGDAAIRSTFSGGVLASTTRPDRARDLLGLFRSGTAARIARSRGMQAAEGRAACVQH